MNITEIRQKWDKHQGPIDTLNLVADVLGAGTDLKLDNLNSGTELDLDTLREMEDKGYHPILDGHNETKIDPTWDESRPNTLFIRFDTLTLNVPVGQEREAELFLRRNFNPDKIDSSDGKVSAWFD